MSHTGELDIELVMSKMNDRLSYNSFNIVGRVRDRCVENDVKTGSGRGSHGRVGLGVRRRCDDHWTKIIERTAVMMMTTATTAATRRVTATTTSTALIVVGG